MPQKEKTEDKGWEERFNEKFEELWGSNGGREGYDSNVKGDVKHFISDTIAEEKRKLSEELEAGLDKMFDDDLPEYIGVRNITVSEVKQLIKKICQEVSTKERKK